jgi:hypothetical protein
MKVDRHINAFDMKKISKNIKVPIICIYDKPKDYPNKIVARLWDGYKRVPTNMVIVADTLDEMRQLKPNDMGVIPRYPNDDAVIVETWI